jgi:hypothetical protein
MPISPAVKWSSPKVRRKRVALFATSVLFLLFGIYRLLSRDYMYAVGSAGLAFIYFWLAFRKMTKLDDNLEQSLSELTDAHPDISDNQYP